MVDIRKIIFKTVFLLSFFICVNNSNGRIIYALAAQGTKVLCDYSSFSGNFTQFTISILKRTPQNTRGTYSYDEQYSFHFMNSDNMTYLTLCYTSYPAESAFQFLERVKEELEQAHGTNFDNINSYGLNSSFQQKLAMKIDYFNKNKESSETYDIQNKSQNLVTPGDSSNQVTPGNYQNQVTPGNSSNQTTPNDIKNKNKDLATPGGIKNNNQTPNNISRLKNEVINIRDEIDDEIFNKRG